MRASSPAAATPKIGPATTFFGRSRRDGRWTDARQHQRVAAASTSDRALVVLTREKGKNDKVKQMLDELGVQSIEVPMVETTPGPDAARLPEVLRAASFDWITVTSPEAASVFIDGWKAAGKPDVRIGVVGKGTGKVLEATREPALRPQFTPSVANAEHMGPELPLIEGGTNRVLYPSSAKASTVLQEGLERRGFDVVRLNTYNTVTVKEIEAETLEIARRARVVAIASPSALKAWVSHVGQDRAEEMTIACIGSTSARAAEKLGLPNVLFPEHPGLEKFVETIYEASVVVGQE